MTDVDIETNLENDNRINQDSNLRIIRWIALIEMRRIFARRGYPSTFEYLKQKFKWAEGEIQRRIEAARFLREVPEAAPKFERDQINMSTLNKASKAIRDHEKRTGRRLAKKEKLDIVDAIDGLSSRQTDQKLIEIFPDQPRKANVVCTLEDADLENLRFAKDFFSHALPNASDSQIFVRLLSDLRRKEEKRKHPKVRTCCYVDPVSGRRCGSTYQTESDHIEPRALGGSDDPSNLRPLCRVHNALEAERTLGVARANAWRNSAGEETVRHC